MTHIEKIVKIHPKSFRANKYSFRPFRMIGLIDVDIEYSYGIERVTLAFFRSSGTNSGKIEGLWYPIVGIKTTTGPFIEFTKYLNFVLAHTTRGGYAKEGWLAKSLFFYGHHNQQDRFVGFSKGKHYESLLEIGKTLRDLYEEGAFQEIIYLNAPVLNGIVTSKSVYVGNKRTQRENYERFIEEIFMGV